MDTKILLVEDEDYIRELYKRQFDLAGYHTEAFSNGKDALTALATDHYQLILLDIMLPDMNGIDILKQIKAQEANKTIPVIMLTNLGQDEIIKEALKIGAEMYIIKASFTPDQIVQEVRSLLGSKKTQ